MLAHLFFIRSSSSDTTQKSCEPQAILEELIHEFKQLCRMINQVRFIENLIQSQFFFL